jgi:acyl-CoA thioester hydrolase
LLIKLAGWREPARGKPSPSPPFGEWNEMPHLSADALAVRVYYEDTDFSGRVYHASYLRFLERGRTEWLRGHGFSHQDFAASSGVVFAVRSLQIDFFSPALMDDLLRVETEVSALRGASIEFRQRIFRGEKELAAATVKVAAIRDGRPARIPPALCRLFEAR